MHSSIKKALTSDDSFGTTLLVCAIDAYGTECLDWEPEALSDGISDIIGEPFRQGLFDRIMAASLVLTSSSFHTDIVTFNSVCRGLSFDKVASSFLPLSPWSLAWGVSEARLLEGPEASDKQAFTDEIALYTGITLSGIGLTKAPSILSFAIFTPSEMDNRDALLSSDLSLMQQYSDGQTEKKNSIETFVQERFNSLLAQIAALELTRGDSAKIKEFITKSNSK